MGSPGRKRFRKKLDPLDVLGEDLFMCILSHLKPSGITVCSSVSKSWRHVASSSLIWDPLCTDLVKGKKHVNDSQDFTSIGRFWFLLLDSKRTKLTKSELCSVTWEFRFKRQAGPYWLSWDPYWTKKGAMMQRRFREDGSVSGVPSHEPFWMPDSECRWRFTKTKDNKRGHFVKINHWPSLTISRTRDWGWRMENCWVVYTSCDDCAPFTLTADC